jgi:protein-glutamine gamma-glutamyltransferase
MNSKWVRNRDQQINIETVVKAITYLVGIIGFIAVFNHVNIFFPVIFLVLLLLSFYFEYSRKFYLPRWILNILSMVVIVLSFYRFKVGDLVSQIMEALLILLAIKLLEDKKFRDYMQIYAITLFLLAGLGLLSLDIAFAAYLFILVILLTISIVLLTYYSQDPNLELSRYTVMKIVLRSMYIPLLAIPLTVVMFAILPRTQYPIFNFLNRADKAKTGFTDNVRLGGVSGIQEDSSAILRVNMEKIDDNFLYWRGIVLDHFDGASWKSSRKHIMSSTKQVDIKGKMITQTVYLEPYENIYLFALDKPVFISLKGTKKYTDFTYTSSGFIEKRTRYDVASIISDTIDDDTIDEETYLQIPENISSKIIDLVRSLASGKGKEEDMRLILGFLNSGSYKYSLENLPVSQIPLEDFLFNVKHGNCEYFASAYAVMLRVAGIPSRLIGGYRGGYYNDMGGYYLVPQKNAHVWVEAYVKKKGWQRIDPTPGGIEAFSSPFKSNVLFRLTLFLDTINYYWFAFVINYNFEKQLGILNSIRTAFKKPSIALVYNKGKTVKYGIVLFFITAVLSAASYIAVKGVRREARERRLLSIFLNKMEKQGYKKKESQGLEEFVLTIQDDKIRKYSLKFVTEFEKLYYRDRTFKDNNMRDLKKMIDLIKA